MDRQKLPPPVSTKITRKLASESTEHNSLLNFYSSISTDESGAPKRWKMSSGVHINEDSITSGKLSPVPNKGTPGRDSSSERKGRPTPKRGAKDRETVDNASSRDSSLEAKDKGKMISDVKRDSSSDSSKVKKSDDSRLKVKVMDKAKFYGASHKVNGDTSGKKTKTRPKSLNLNTKLANGEDDSFKSPDPLTPCNIAVKRRKGRPKETPPTLVAESPVEIVEMMESSMTQTNFDNEELDADIEDNIEPVIKIKKKPGRKPKVAAGVIPKVNPNVAKKVLGQRKLKGAKFVSKLKKSGKPLIHKTVNNAKASGPKTDGPVKRKAGRPPGAKNKTTILKEQLVRLKNIVIQKPEAPSQSEESSKVTDHRGDDTLASVAENADVKTESDVGSGNEVADSVESKDKPSSNSKKGKALGLKKGGAKSLGKLKKESDEIQRIRKKRILNSYAANSDNVNSLDHLPKNDLRRYLQMKLIERLNGNRSHSQTIHKTLSDKTDKSEMEDASSEDDSLPPADLVNDSDVQNLSALVEQKRVRSESDVSSEQRRSVSRSRKSSVDFSKISDNESICSEMSVNSVNSSKRIFVLGEDKPESDDTIRTRQRVEIVPGKSRKRTLSGEFDLVDEVQLRKEQKLARMSESDSIPFIGVYEGVDLQVQGEVTPAVTPVQIKKRTSPKIAAIKQRLEAKKDCLSPFVSEHRKRLLKQSPFLSRIRRRKKSVPGNRSVRLVSDTVVKLEQNYEVFVTANVPDIDKDKSEQSVVKDVSEVEIVDNKGLDVKSAAILPEQVIVNQKLGDTDIVMKPETSENKDIVVSESIKDEVSDIDSKAEGALPDIPPEDKPVSVSEKVNEILEDVLSTVMYICEPESRASLSVNEAGRLGIEDMLTVSSISSVTPRRLSRKKRAGRPKKVKKHLGAPRKSPSVPGQETYTGARRGRKPKSATQGKDSPPESTVVRKFELRQKISRSPLDNIALKQSIEENEYYKNEAQRANRKEAKQQKSKRVYALAAEGPTIYPFEPPMLEVPATVTTATVSSELYQTETATESECEYETDEYVTQPKTLEDFLNECKPCSVILTDFFTQLQRAQQKTVSEEESALETEDSLDDSIDSSEGTVTAEENAGAQDPETTTTTTTTTATDEPKTNKSMTSFDYNSVLSLSSISPDKKHKKSPEEKGQKGDSSPVLTTIKIKTPINKTKSGSPKTYKKPTPEHQTARKTVPPLKIKLTGGLKKKTYMVESPLQDYESLLNPPSVEKRPKKKKSKSSSKSGSDSDHCKDRHHHHHHKKHNKSPLVGQIGSFGEKKSKPTAIVAASPSVKPNLVPKGQFEATFLEFIQSKERDTPILPKGKSFYDTMNTKDYKVTNEGSIMVTASLQSTINTSTPSITESQSQASLYNSISKNTSLVNTLINENVQKSLENSLDTNQKNDNQLFIGVVGARSNLQYFCSRCESEIHKTDDLVLKHFAQVHPGQPIMYRRVADTQHKEKVGPSLVGSSREPVVNVSANENAALNSKLNMSAGILEAMPCHLNGTSQSSIHNPQPLGMESKRVEDGEEDEGSDTGSLNLKIVEVVSLKDQLHALDPEEHHEEESHHPLIPAAHDRSFANSGFSPELRIPHFPRSTALTSASAYVTYEHTKQQVLDKQQKVQTTLPTSLRPHQRKTPGIITPGRLENTFKCEKCNVHAPVLAAMVAHLRNSHSDIPRLFQCPYCRDKEAENEAKIHQHIRQCHPTDNPNPPVALSERAKGNLRTLSVRVPENKAGDASFLEKDIYMCLNCKVHMPSLEAIYDHLEHVHTEVFVFVCSACKVFKSKTEQVVLQHIKSEPRCNTMEKNISLAIDGNQFTRVPCLLKDKNKVKEKTTQQPKVSQNSMQASVSKHAPSNTHTATPSSVMQALQKQTLHPAQLLRPALSMQQMFQHPFGPFLAPPIVPPNLVTQTIMTPHLVPQQPVLAQPVMAQPVMAQPVMTQPVMAQPVLPQQQKSPQVPLSVSQTSPMSQVTLAVTTLSSTTSTVSATSTPAPSPSPSQSSGLVKSSVSTTAPPKPTGAKKRKNLLESIQHIKMHKQRQQLSEKPDPLELGPLASSPASSVGESSQAPPPLIRGPPPLIRFDQLNQVPLSAAAPIQPGGISQQIVKQVSTPLQMSDNSKGSVPPRQIHSSLFDTSDPEAFKPIQRTPVLNVPSVPRSNRTPTHTPGQKVSQQKSSSGGSAPLDLSKNTPTHSPASTPPVQEKIPTQPGSDVANPEMYNVFKLKPSTQAQLPKQALQNKVALHQMPQKPPGPPQTVRQNTANTISYRPQHPHVATTQTPQVINMPLGMLNTIGNIVVTMPNFQVVPAMPAQYIRMSSPAGPVSVAVAMPTVSAARPVLATPQVAFQQPMNVNLPAFKCPYCPKLISLTFAQVQPHIESQHPGCSVVFMPLENKK